MLLSMGSVFFYKSETYIPVSTTRETLKSHLMNSPDYFINIQLISIILSWFELTKTNLYLE